MRFLTGIHAFSFGNARIECLSYYIRALLPLNSYCFKWIFNVFIAIVKALGGSCSIPDVPASLPAAVTIPCHLKKRWCDMQNPQSTPDHYATLGIASDASEREIRTAYYALSRTRHPDRGGTDDAQQRIGAAYEVLSDPIARQAYDSSRNPAIANTMHPMFIGDNSRNLMEQTLREKNSGTKRSVRLHNQSAGEPYVLQSNEKAIFNNGANITLSNNGESLTIHDLRIEKTGRARSDGRVLPERILYRSECLAEAWGFLGLHAGGMGFPQPNKILKMDSSGKVSTADRNTSISVLPPGTHAIEGPSRG